MLWTCAQDPNEFKSFKGEWKGFTQSDPHIFFSSCWLTLMLGVRIHLVFFPLIFLALVINIAVKNLLYFHSFMDLLTRVIRSPWLWLDPWSDAWFLVYGRTSHFTTWLVPCRCLIFEWCSSFCLFRCFAICLFDSCHRICDVLPSSFGCFVIHTRTLSYDSMTALASLVWDIFHARLGFLR